MYGVAKPFDEMFVVPKLPASGFTIDDQYVYGVKFGRKSDIDGFQVGFRLKKVCGFGR
jgi:hypothetical protein